MYDLPSRPISADELRATAEQLEHDEARAIREEANGAFYVDHHGAVQESPVPLGLGGPPMAFPTHALPSAMADYVAAVADSYEVPADLPGMLVLGALATTVQGRWVVAPRPGWREPINLYCVVALEPGEQKTSAFRAIFHPLWDHERKLREVWTKESSHLEQLLAVRKRGEEKVTAPPIPRVFVDDATPEVVAYLLAEQGERLAVASDEGTLFSMICGMYSKTPNNGVFLKAHDGGRYTVDRRDLSKHVTLTSPLLTMALAVQPAILRLLATKPELRGQGMWARFLYSIPSSKIGSKTFDAPPISWHCKDAYDRLINALLVTRPESWPIAADPLLPSVHTFKGEPAVIKFSLEAWALLRAVCVGLDRRMAEGEDLHSIQDWACKLRGAIVRLAGLFHIARCVDEQIAPESRPVEVSVLEQALQVGHYLLMHAHRAFATMDSENAEKDAMLLLRWLQKEKLQRVTRRQIQRESPVRKAARVASAIGMLIDLGHLDPMPPRGASRVPSYRVITPSRTS